MMASTDVELTNARLLARNGHGNAAAACYYQLLLHNPQLTEAHVFLGEMALQRNDPATAVAHCEQALNTQLNDVNLHKNLDRAISELLKTDNAEQALTAIVGNFPFAFCSEIQLARVQERQGHTQSAIIRYLRAIKTAQLRGFWLGEASTPPWLKSLVTHAMDFAQRGRRALFQQWLGHFNEQYGRDEMSRVQQCIAMYVGEIPAVYADPRQKPGFLYFPGLPVAAQFDRSVLVFADWYEAQTDVIRDEMLAVLARQEGIQPFHYQLNETQRASLTAGAPWDAYFFFRDGLRIDEHHLTCPKTSEILRQLPLDHIREHGPEVCFSIMQPGAHILPHRGVTNTRSVLHLGLTIPEHCALNLTGITEIHWQEAHCFAFDDTYEHEAWNRSTQTRVVLLGDIWNPYLTEAERGAVTELIGWIGDFNRSTEAAAIN